MGNPGTGANTGDPGTRSGTRTNTQSRIPDPRRTRRTTGARLDRPVIPKGYAILLERQKMSTKISAQELKWWTRQWEALKNASAFGYQSETIKISYLCQFIDRNILNAIGYRRFSQERDLLVAVLEYVNDRLHPTMIKQFNVLRSRIEG